jgi:hypothetical protein
MCVYKCSSLIFFIEHNVTIKSSVTKIVLIFGEKVRLAKHFIGSILCILGVVLGVQFLSFFLGQTEPYLFSIPFIAVEKWHWHSFEKFAVLKPFLQSYLGIFRHFLGAGIEYKD